MLYIFKVYIFLMKNFQEFLDDLICLLKENKVFLLSVERFAGVLRRFALFLGWTVRVFAFRDPCLLYEWKKVDWGKKFIYREKRYDWHICCQRKKKWKNLFQSKKIARRVVYKWQESVNSVILFNAFVNLPWLYTKIDPLMENINIQRCFKDKNHWGPQFEIDRYSSHKWCNYFPFYS